MGRTRITAKELLHEDVALQHELDELRFQPVVVYTPDIYPVTIPLGQSYTLFQQEQLPALNYAGDETNGMLAEPVSTLGQSTTSILAGFKNVTPLFTTNLAPAQVGGENLYLLLHTDLDAIVGQPFTTVTGQRLQGTVALFRDNQFVVAPISDVSGVTYFFRAPIRKNLEDLSEVAQFSPFTSISAQVSDLSLHNPFYWVRQSDNPISTTSTSYTQVSNYQFNLPSAGRYRLNLNYLATVNSNNRAGFIRLTSASGLDITADILGNNNSSVSGLPYTLTVIIDNPEPRDCDLVISVRVSGDGATLTLFRYVLEIERKEIFDVTPEDPDAPAWDPTISYVAGSYVTHNGALFYSRHFIGIGAEPGNIDTHWQEDTNEWRFFNVYEQGSVVIHDGSQYEARWWSQNHEPGVHAVWLLLG